MNMLSLRRFLTIVLLFSVLMSLLPANIYSQTDPTATSDSASQVEAQTNRLYLPMVNTVTCEGQGFAVSKVIHQKGLTLGDIADDYLMNPHDLLTLNKGIFQLTGTAYTLQVESRVCMPRQYSLIWNQANGAYVKLFQNRDRWNDYLLTPGAVEAASSDSTSQTDTFIFTTPTYPITGVLFQIVGEWFSATGLRSGYIARVAVGSVGKGLLRGVAEVAGYAEIAIRVGMTTANAVHFPATVLSSGATYIHYSVIPANGKLYVRCYNAGIDEGKKRDIGDVVGMLVYTSSGTDQRACVFTSQPQGVEAGVLAVAHGVRLVERAAAEMVRKGTTSDLDAAKIIQDLVDYYDQRETGKPIAIVPDEECPDIDYNTLWNQAVDIALMYSHYKYQNPDMFDEKERFRTDDVVRTMLEYKTITFSNSYRERRPRRHEAWGMSTTRYGLPVEQYYFNLDVVCYYVSTDVLSPYKWFNRVDVGSEFGKRSLTESGAVRSDEGEIYHLPYPFGWRD